MAICDRDGILATPLTTIPRDLRADDSAVPSDMSRLRGLVGEREAVEVIIGLPVSLSGKESHAAALARKYADRLAAVIAPVPVVLADERMSTVAATRRLSEQGVRGRRQRKVVDQAAAAVILQGWLDTQRRRA